MTAMSVAKRKAQYAVGALFPGFHVVDARGREWTLEDFRGKVLLVDFWARDWTPWKRDLDNLRAFHDRYDINGFEVLGICLEPAPGDLASFAASQRIPWPLVGGDGTLAKQLGLFGEAANFLVDRNGVIIGRDLRGADLAAAAKRALTAPPTR
jgi:peroxiredoxin